MRETLARETSDAVDTRERALARIAVRPPYFGLGAMEQNGEGVVSAMVPVAAPVRPERGPVEAAQVARHLAILGSCAAALGRDDDTQHHYLATKAHYARLAGGPEALNGGLLQAEAVASWVDRRSARALVKLMTPDGLGLHLLDVHYSVLTPKMFHRFNPPLEPAPLDGGADRGTNGVVAADGDLPEEIVEIGADGIRVDCGPIPASACAGHFPGNPAAPVAIVMGRLCRAAGLGLAAKLDSDIEWQIEEGHVTATKLARAGQRLVLEARYGEPVPSGHLMHGTATADRDVIGEVAVTLSTYDASSESEAGPRRRSGRGAGRC